jgi:nanoRNase/pAp phosphatase (c-di-AMP/oligoRNAs hydrolase)
MAKASNGRVPSLLQRPKRLPGLQAVVTRFGGPLGKRFTRHNLALLAQVASAHSALRRAAGAIRGRGANIFTQWVGDPDALGSAVVLKAVLQQLGAREVRILTGTLGHPQNRKMVERCGIQLLHPNEDRLPRGLNCMVDSSPPLGRANTGAVLPARDFFFVADHHAEPEDVEAACRETGVRRVKLAFVGLPVGSTSAFLAALGLAFDVWDTLGPAGRAAAALGIYTDTSALLHGATPLDFRMFEKLTRDEATLDLLDELRDYRIPPAWLLCREAAFAHMETLGSVRIAPVGLIDAAHRDVVAEIASDLLRVENTSIGMAVAVTERRTEVSVRADSRLLGGDRERIVRVIDYLLSEVFPGVSGFKYERRPPHRVEGGASVPLGAADMREMQNGASVAAPPDDALSRAAVACRPPANHAAVLAHCRAIAARMVNALQRLEVQRPDEMDGVL